MDAMVHSGSTWHASDVCRCDCHVAGRRAIAPARCMERGVRRLRRIHQIYGASQGEFFRRHGHWKYRRHERPADRARGKGGHGDCSTDILIIFEYLPSFFKLEPAGSSLLWLAFLIHFLLGDLGWPGQPMALVEGSRGPAWQKKRSVSA